MTARADEVEADPLQTTLAAEHAALYVLSLLGARTSESAEADLYAAVRDAYGEHRDRRDVLTGLLAGLGATPVAAAPAYVAPPGLDTVEGRAAGALALERGCAVTYAALVAQTTGTTRGLAIGWLEAAAVRELSFRGTPEIFPGADELTDL